MRNLGLAKLNVEYILKDFSEEKKIVTCSLENGSCGKKLVYWAMYMALWLKLLTEWDCRVVLHDFKNVYSYTG